LREIDLEAVVPRVEPDEEGVDREVSGQPVCLNSVEILSFSDIQIVLFSVDLADILVQPKSLVLALGQLLLGFFRKSQWIWVAFKFLNEPN